MSTRTIVDASGEIVSVVTGSDTAIALNTPKGCVAIREMPPAPDAYRVEQAWVLRAPRPSVHHTWDIKAKAWLDLRTLDTRKQQLRAPLLQELVAEDARSLRPVAELVAALAAGALPTAKAKAVLEAINERKAALRDALALIEAASDNEALADAAVALRA